jgi:hypothetical protein
LESGKYRGSKAEVARTLKSRYSDEIGIVRTIWHQKEDWIIDYHSQNLRAGRQSSALTSLSRAAEDSIKKQLRYSGIERENDPSVSPADPAMISARLYF